MNNHFRPTIEPTGADAWKCKQPSWQEINAQKPQLNQVPAPVVEGEWAEWKMELKKIWRHYGTLLELESFITNLLHTEREKGRRDRDEEMAMKIEDARAEERERIVKMIEKTIQEERYSGAPRALNVLRDKLTNK